ncbi:RHS repeat-associated core domain-containing protein [Kribbella yunnanensis]|uniref:RHS repeat-associated core domain-containing protein n=1 Tax=Kribbella yunnanensis TaxID=190194 RepID=UPI0031DF4C33
MTRWIPGDAGAELKGSYYTNYDYKPDQKTPSLISYPDGGGLGADNVSFSYTSQGLPLRMYNAAGSTFVNDVEYNQFGDQTVLDLGSKHDMPITNLYEDGTRRLSRSAAGKGEHVVSDHVYTYDPTGNVLKDHNLVDGGDAQCFDYDGHRRITEAWTPANADCTQAPSTLGLGGVAPYWQSWTYTPTGLRKTQVDHSSAGNTTSTFTYNTDQPHTLAGVTQTGAGAAAPKSYTYDARGNTTVRPGQSLTWNAQGKLAKLSGTEGDTEYVYDADGSLLLRRNPTETTLFLGELELTLNKATRKVQGKRQYSFHGQIIGVRSDNGTPTADFSWLITDYHGTSQVAVDSATLQATKRYAKPFGDPRGTEPTAWPDDHGFLNKPEDKVTGLTTIGAREYDPTIGRFISLDPLLDPNDPQQMLGYTYANDNPTSGSDPTGLINADDGDGGGGYTDDDVDVLYPSGGPNDNPNPRGPNGGYGGGNDDGGSNHPKQKKRWHERVAHNVTDAVDHARQWAEEHASTTGFFGSHDLFSASVALPEACNCRPWEQYGGGGGGAGGGRAGGGSRWGGIGDFFGRIFRGTGGSTSNGVAPPAPALPPVVEIPSGSSGGPTAYKRIPPSLLQQWNIGKNGNPKLPTPLCSYCRTNPATGLDHVIPRVKGGNLNPENITPACTACNSSKGARLAPVNPPKNYLGEWPPPWWPSWMRPK